MPLTVFGHVDFFSAVRDLRDQRIINNLIDAVGHTKRRQAHADAVRARALPRAATPGLETHAAALARRGEQAEQQMRMTMSTENIRSNAQKDKMQKTLELERANEVERHKRETLYSLVREQVMHALGEPNDLLHVQVRPLWGPHYRVNVFVGVGIACARISHSFFLVTDGDGSVLESTPKIKRQY